MRGVAPGRVDLPKVRRSGVSATVGFVMVIALLLVGGSLAVSGGGGLLSGGGRFFGAEASPSPTPAPSVVPGTGEVVVDNGETGQTETPKAKGTKFICTCDNNAIKDLSKGKWVLSDVEAGRRKEKDGTPYDQVYWKLTRTTDKKTKTPTTVSMQWSTPQELQERFNIPRVGGDRALLITFNGPVSISANQGIERDQFEAEGINQIQKVQMFERNGKVRTVIGLKQDSCARMNAVGWGQKANKKGARINLDIERVYEGS